MPITPAVAVALTALSAAASYAQQKQANDNAKKIADYQNSQMNLAYKKTLAVSQAQGEIAAAQKREAIQNRYDAYRGATIASAAERGTADSQSSLAAINSLGYQASRESAKTTMEQRLNQQNLSISSMPQWQINNSQSTVLAGITGGMQGLSLGMGLLNSQQGLDINRATARAHGAIV